MFEQKLSRWAVLSLLFASLVGCAPPLVWGGDDATKDRLLNIVPIGSSITALQREAEDRNWRIQSDDRAFDLGLPHYFGDGCVHQGGVSRYAIVAEYGLLTTSVETVWLFDAEAKLSELCVRRTTDAL